MLKSRLFVLALAGLLVLPVARAAVITQDFSTDPLPAGWQIFGDTNLFAWDATNQNLRVTWDSRQTNSYFCRPLGTVLAKEDDFSLAFDLSLDDFTPGVDPAKTNSPFSISIGLLNQADATAPGFHRGSGFESPNLMDFSFFPDPGGDWQWGPSLTVVFCDRTGFNWSSGGFVSAALTSNDVFHVVMTYVASNRVMQTQVLRNGQPFAALETSISGANFTDYRLDTVAVCSYSDAGQDPNYAGSILAHGRVDNFILTTPPPPAQNLAGAFTNGVWQLQFADRTNWMYTLERTADFVSWTNVSPPAAGNGTNLCLQDTNAPADKAFYRVRANRP